jgi:hypothetical protein
MGFPTAILGPNLVVTLFSGATITGRYLVGSLSYSWGLKFEASPYSDRSASLEVQGLHIARFERQNIYLPIKNIWGQVLARSSLTEMQP